MSDIINLLLSKSLLPISFLAFAGFFILLTGLYGIFARWSHFFSIIGLGLGLLLVGAGGDTAVNLMAHNPLIIYGWLLILGSTFVVLQLSGRFWQTAGGGDGRGANGIMDDTQQVGMFRFEIPTLMLWAVTGLAVMVSAGHFVTLYLGLELSSLCFYFLVNVNRQDQRASEAALKYYILGSMASAVFLFGVSLIYGMTGSLDFVEIKNALGNTAAGGGATLSLTLGLLFVIIGLGFKVSAAPFHFWAPDVYQGSLSPITAFFTTAPKLAGLIIIARLLLEYFSPLQAQWQVIVGILAVLSLVFGAFPALIQNNLKRFIALSGVSHVGFLLLALVALSKDANFDSLNFFTGYLFIYLTQTIGLMAILLGYRKVANKVVGKGDKGDAKDELQEQDLCLSDFAGLSRYRPKLAFGLLILLFSLAGIPPLLGFFSKWWVLIALVKFGFGPLAVVAVLLSLVSATYYLKIIKTIYIDAVPDGFTLAPRQLYDGQKNTLLHFWFWLMVLIQIGAPLLLGKLMGWLLIFRP
ncbi:MAG: NADH-quinone oxidoreductase subunit N [Hydrotalea sp.]|nr:NADH-quinone oxidoreductase subunit N [Hydrotalea sp.]